MYVISHNGNVILGPMKWNARRFADAIEEDCEVQASLPATRDNDNVITVNEEIKIYPAVGAPLPSYNARTEFLNGPYWTFTETEAIAEMEAQPLPLEAIKNFMRAEAAGTRWTKQTAGVEVEVNGTTYKFATDDNARSTFHQYVTSGVSSLNWKVDQQTWIVLTAVDIQAIFTAILGVIQAAFDWETAKNDAITAATLETIETISTKE